MNWVDLLIVAIIAWTTFRAFTTGLVRELVTLLGLVAGLLLAGAFYNNLADNLAFLIDDTTTRQLISFGAIFAGTAIAGQVLGAILKQTAGLLLLGPLDHLGGALFGFAKGLLLVEVMLIAISVFPAQASVARGVDDSTLAPLFLDHLPVAQLGLPGEFSDPLQQLDHWRQLLGAVIPQREATGSPTP